MGLQGRVGLPKVASQTTMLTEALKP